MWSTRGCIFCWFIGALLLDGKRRRCAVRCLLRQGAENERQLQKGIDRDQRRTDRQADAHNAIAHPGGHLTRQPRPLLDNQDFNTVPPRAATGRKPLSI